MHIQRSGLVLGVKIVVSALELHWVHPASAYRELTPGVVGIDGQQRVVQIK
jgi:hypothetical protein